jgi:type II secretory pathway pseudopilin PulG
MTMKKTGIIVMMAAMLLCCLPAQAQLGGLINKGKKAVQKAKEVKEKVDEGIKKANGDIDFYYMNSYQGFYRSKNRKIVLDNLNKDGKKVIYTIEKNGDVKSDDGRKVGEVLAGGVVNCHAAAPYLTMAANGDVIMDGEAVGHIDEAGNVTLEGSSIGKAPGIDKQVVAYIYFGILLDKPSIATARAKAQEEKLRAEQKRKQAEEARLKAAQEAQAKANAAGTKQTKTTQTKTAQANGKKSTNNTKPKKVQEWTIEKNGSRGFVDANGVVYDSSHKKIGQLPNGSGDIKDGWGSTIGSISSGDIYKNGTKVATVSSGGSISVPGSNATVAEVRGAGRIDMTADSKTLGYCDVRPYEWAVAIIFCDFFNF